MRTTLAAGAVVLALAGCSTMEHMGTMTPGMRLQLSGINEVPPNNSSGSGTATVNVAADCSVTASVSVVGMTATAAHIHTGTTGANGGVAVPFTKTGDNTFSAPAGAKLNSDQCAAYKRGDTYVNVHSATYPNGELRAQLPGG
jgi:hypothetical protein